MEFYIITSSLISIFAVFFVMKFVLGSDAHKRHAVLQEQNEHYSSQSYRFSRDQFCQICLETTKNISTKSNFFILYCSFIGLAITFMGGIFFLELSIDLGPFSIVPMGLLELVKGPFSPAPFKTGPFLLFLSVTFIISTFLIYILNKPKFICSVCDYENFTSQVELERQPISQRIYTLKDLFAGTVLIFVGFNLIGVVLAIAQLYFGFYFGDWLMIQIGLPYIQNY